MVGQYSTHIDPPAHFDPNSMTADEIPVKQMILPLVVFNVTPMLKQDPNYVTTLPARESAVPIREEIELFQIQPVR
jgi:kynurenine formamidase